MSRKKKPVPCNVPGCERPREGHGLCKRCLRRATTGKDAAKRGEALMYADPPFDEDLPEMPEPDIDDACEAEVDAMDAEPVYRPPKPKSWDDPTALKTPQAAPVPAARAARQRIALVSAFALHMGLGRPTLNELTGERSWISPHNGQAFILDADGRGYKGLLAVDELFNLDDLDLSGGED